jgi:methylphosphotriester-DNA--protein-cysteine methyltransferase
MIAHSKLGSGFSASKSLYNLILTKEIGFAGNSSLKIYGTLSCKAGKRMKATNRVFFRSIREAAGAGYRPCSICLKHQYVIWKQKT